MLYKILLVESRDHIVDDFTGIDWGEDFSIETCRSAQEALSYLQEHPVDFIYVGNKLTDSEGAQLVARLRALEDFRSANIIMISDEPDHKRRIREMAAGVDDYIRYPFEGPEVVARIKILMDEAGLGKDRLVEPSKGFSGNLSEMNVLDLLQTMELGQKTGIIYLIREQQKARIFVRNGQVYDAELGSCQGETALDRLFTWNEGRFIVAFQEIDRENRINKPPQEIAYKGMKILEEWESLLREIPNMGAILELVRDVREDEVEEECASLLPLLDGRRSLRRVIQDSNMTDIQTLKCILFLRSRGLLQEILPDLGEDFYQESRFVRSDASPVGSNQVASVIDDFIQNLTRRPSAFERLKRHYPDTEKETGLNGDKIRSELSFTRTELQYLKRKLL